MEENLPANTSESSNKVPLKNKIVGVVCILFGIPLLLLPLIYLFFIIPQLSELYESLNIQRPNPVIGYTLFVALFGTGILNFFIGIKNIKYSLHLHKYLVYGIILLILNFLVNGLLVAGTMIVVINPIYKLTSEINDVPAKTMSTPTPTDPTANWKIYTNTKFNYSIKYPSTWKTRNISGAETREKEGMHDANSLQLFDSNIKSEDPSGMIFIQRFESSPSYDTEWKKVNTTLNNIAVVKLEKQTYHLNSFIYLVELQNNNGILQIQSTYTSANPVKGVLTQILSTFKFLDQENTKSFSCNDSDNRFCEFISEIHSDITSKNFNNFIENQITEKVSCTHEIPDYPSVCKGKSEGAVVYGYTVGRNQSEGNTYSKEQFLSYLTTYLKSVTPESYNGFVMSDKKDRAVLVYAKTIKDPLFAINIYKINGKWKIRSIIDGVASEDYTKRDNVILTYFDTR